jgi:hypothetical protein
MTDGSGEIRNSEMGETHSTSEGKQSTPKRQVYTMEGVRWTPQV